jgi:hypothetical protein
MVVYLGNSNNSIGKSVSPLQSKVLKFPLKYSKNYLCWFSPMKIKALNFKYFGGCDFKFSKIQNKTCRTVPSYPERRAKCFCCFSSSSSTFSSLNFFVLPTVITTVLLVSCFFVEEILFASRLVSFLCVRFCLQKNIYP